MFFLLFFIRLLPSLTTHTTTLFILGLLRFQIRISMPFYCLSSLFLPILLMPTFILHLILSPIIIRTIIHRILKLFLHCSIIILTRLEKLLYIHILICLLLNSLFHFLSKWFILLWILRLIIVIFVISTKSIPRHVYAIIGIKRSEFHGWKSIFSSIPCWFGVLGGLLGMALLLNFFLFSIQFIRLSILWPLYILLSFVFYIYINSLRLFFRLNKRLTREILIIDSFFWNFRSTRWLLFPF